MKLLPVVDAQALGTYSAIEAASLEHDHEALPADPIEERLPLLEGALPDGGERTLFHVAMEGDDAVAAVELNLPTIDNLTAVSVTVHVPPPLRGRGIGTRVLATALEETAALGRPRVFFEAPSPYPSGKGIADRLLAAAGARPVLKEVRRLLELRAAPVEAPPAPPGYRLVQWVDRVPGEHVDAMAHLMHRMSTDAPLEDMDWEPEVWTAQRYRDKETGAIARGRIRYATLAVHEESGQVAGFTDIGVSRFAPEVGYQWETIVEKAHRGHGLGYVLKAHNHRALADGSPSTRWLNTWNAESNTHMVGINERLGFRPMEYWTEWQLDR